jgi:hypothetical protein
VLIGSACVSCLSCDLRENATHRLTLMLPEGCRGDALHAEISSVGFNMSDVETVRHTLAAALGGDHCAAVQLAHEEVQRGAAPTVRGYQFLGGVEACDDAGGSSSSLREDAVVIEFQVSPFQFVWAVTETEKRWATFSTFFLAFLSLQGLLGLLIRLVDILAAGGGP